MARLKPLPPETTPALNRWNDTLGTPLETSPAAVATQALAAHGWSAGKHAQ